MKNYERLDVIIRIIAWGLIAFVIVILLKNYLAYAEVSENLVGDHFIFNYTLSGRPANISPQTDFFRINYNNSIFFNWNKTCRYINSSIENPYTWVRFEIANNSNYIDPVINKSFNFTVTGQHNYTTTTELPDGFYWWRIGFFLNNTNNSLCNGTCPFGIKNSSTDNPYSTWDWLEGSFQIDTVNPFWTTFMFPKSDNSTLVSGTMPWDMRVSDTNLYRILVNVTKNSTGEYVWSYYMNDWNETIWNATDEIGATDISSWDDGIYKVELSACDDGSSPKLKKLKAVINDEEISIKTAKKEMKKDLKKLKFKKQKKLKFKENEKEIFNLLPATDVITSINLTDNDKHYKIGWTLFEPIKGKGQKTFNVNISSQQKIIKRNNKLIFDNYYIDFSDIKNSGFEYKLEKADDYNYILKVDITGKTGIINIDPVVGGLNNRTEYYTFEVDNTNPTLYYNTPTTSSGTHQQTWVMINVTCADNNLDKCLLNWNGTFEEFEHHNGNLYWTNKSTSVDGDYYFYVFANDTSTPSNNRTEETRYVKIKSLVAETPKTYDANLQNYTKFLVGERVNIKINITDVRTDIANVRITIKNPNNEIKVNEETMTKGDAIPNGFTYEYQYVIPDEANNRGEWTVEIHTNDTAGAVDSNSTTFFVPITYITLTPDPAYMCENNDIIKLNVSTEPIIVGYSTTINLVDEQGLLRKHCENVTDSNGSYVCYYQLDDSDNYGEWNATVTITKLGKEITNSSLIKIGKLNASCDIQPDKVYLNDGDFGINFDITALGCQISDVNATLYYYPAFDTISPLKKIIGNLPNGSSASGQWVGKCTQKGAYFYRINFTAINGNGEIKSWLCRTPALECVKHSTPSGGGGGGGMPPPPVNQTENQTEEMSLLSLQSYLYETKSLWFSPDMITVEALPNEKVKINTMICNNGRFDVYPTIKSSSPLLNVFDTTVFLKPEKCKNISFEVISPDQICYPYCLATADAWFGSYHTGMKIKIVTKINETSIETQTRLNEALTKLKILGAEISKIRNRNGFKRALFASYKIKDIDDYYSVTVNECINNGEDCEARIATLSDMVADAEKLNYNLFVVIIILIIALLTGYIVVRKL